MTTNPKRAVILLVVLVALVGIPLAISSPLSFTKPISLALAAAVSLDRPFGGRVILNVPCPYSGGYAIIVGPPVGGTYVFTPASKIFEYRLPFPTNWVLGLAGSVQVPCLIPGPFGIPVPNPAAPAGFPIIIMGTSQTP